MKPAHNPQSGSSLCWSLTERAEKISSDDEWQAELPCTHRQNQGLVGGQAAEVNCAEQEMQGMQTEANRIGRGWQGKHRCAWLEEGDKGFGGQQLWSGRWVQR